MSHAQMYRAWVDLLPGFHWLSWGSFALGRVETIAYGVFFGLVFAPLYNFFLVKVAEGVHLGAMAGTVDLVQRVSTGLEVRGDVLHLAPELPREMKRLDMRIRYRGHSLDLRLTRGSFTSSGRDGATPPITLCVDGEICEFVRGTTRVFRLDDDATDRGTHRDVPGDAP